MDPAFRSRLEELWTRVGQIPAGRVISYGDLGRQLRGQPSGRMVGRWMAGCPDDLPWWRVVNRLGELPVAKRGPELAMLQRTQLEAEGVEFESDRVRREFFLTHLDP